MVCAQHSEMMSLESYSLALVSTSNQIRQDERSGPCCNPIKLAMASSLQRMTPVMPSAMRARLAGKQLRINTRA